MSAIFPVLGWIAVLALAAAAIHGIRDGIRQKDYYGWAIAGLYVCAAVIILAVLGVIHPLAAGIYAAAAFGVTTGISAKISGWGALGTLIGFAGSAIVFLVTDARALPHRIGGLLDDDGEAPPEVVPVPVPAPAPPAPFAPPPGARRRPEIRARAMAAAAAGPRIRPAAPGEWGQVISGTADFRAGNNVEFVMWLVTQVYGIYAWGTAVEDQHEASITEIGIDAKAVAIFDEWAESIVACAETGVKAANWFCQHFELPDAFVDEGGTLAYRGDWHQGSPDL
jgi:hypothetical protein